MTGPANPRAAARRTRAFGVLALLGIALLCALLVDLVVSNFGWVLLGLAGLATVVTSAWWVLTSLGVRRVLATGALAVGVAAVVGAIVGAGGGSERVLARLVVAGVLLSGVTLAARWAVTSSSRALAVVATRRTAPPRRSVLIGNPRSGGGKVERFGLVEHARSMGVEVRLLEPGHDLERLARSAVEEGADCLGMAGGDGSQALVASIAIEHGLPFVCIPAGTRNHFALDLGLDRDDPLAALRAFRDGLERRVDYATVNGRLFVNNVSLGVYATIVQQDGYRDHKRATSAALLPGLLGDADHPFDLQFRPPGGPVVDGPFLVQVSNNPYVMGPSPDLSQRRRLDTGALGVFAVTGASGAEATEIVTRVLAGHHRPASRRSHVVEFTAPAFEVRSRCGQALAGVDGEAVQLDTPLDFRIHPQGLRLLVPEGNVEAAIRRQARGVDPHRLLALALHPDAVPGGLVHSAKEE